MCLITHMKSPLIAKEEIKVYKVIKKDSNESLFAKNYKYVKGSNVPEKVNKLIFNGIYSLGWLHAFLDKGKAERFASLDIFNNNRKVVEMYIPKGARYFIGDDYDSDFGDYIENEEICASELVWK